MTADRSKRTGLPAGAGVTPAEAALFNVVQYGICVPPEDLAGRATSPDYSLCGPLAVEECRSALTACLARGWLQVIDEAALHRIAVEIREEGLLGPVYGMPPTGGVDFTSAGAAMWHRLLGILREGRDRPAFAFTDVVHCRTARYFMDRAAALAEIEQARESWDRVEITGPVEIGPWRVRWWHRFPKGYRIDIAWWSRWQGCCGDGQGWFLPRSPRWRSEPERWRQVLDRHGVGLPEWLILPAVAGGHCNYPSSLPAKAAHFTERDYGVAISREECRAGMEACQVKGWLRIIDHQVTEEIDALLRADAAVSPLPAEAVPDCGEVDFTATGAALYQGILADFLGRDGANDLCVWRELYREEHRYGEREQDIQSALQEFAGSREEIVSSNVVPIGPWCVWWWERFSSGYRLEVQIRSLKPDVL